MQVPVKHQRPNSTARRRPRPAFRNPDPESPPPFALILDEAAVAIRFVTVPRLVIEIIATAIAGMILPWQTCAIWLSGVLLLEGVSWVAGRPQAPGETPSSTARRNFALRYVSLNAAWLLLAVLFCATGTAQGEASGVALFLVIGAVGVILFYNTPAVFLLAGVAPGIGALAVLARWDGHGWRQMLPIWGVLAMNLIFNIGRALETPPAQQAQRWLEAALGDYETLAGSLADVIFRTDIEGLCNYVSPGCKAMLGYDPDELIGRTRAHIDHPDNDVPGLMEALGRMAADPARSEILVSRVRHKDGRWLWVQSNLKLTVEQGAIVGCIDIMRDVTAQVAADAALAAAKREAESANRAKAEFLANVSHEIRTPMNGILSALHLLDREPISAEARELMRHADDSGRMLSQLLNDVLDFSKIEAGQLDLSPEAMNVGEALEGVIALLAGQARAKGVALTCEIAGRDRWIEGDPVRVRQAIFNLIGNAVKFTARGHVIARLAVEPVAPDRLRIALEIEDTGIGLSPEAQSHLFERFRQAEGDTARRYGGTGLGLSITQALVGMMGGTLTFSSVEGAGSTFRMAFEAPAAEAVTAQPADAGLLEGVSILLVEDNPTNRLMARTLLERMGARVEEAEDGIQGLEAARRGAHDLILMDIQMPHMDGVAATRAIRGLPSAVARTPILGVTANVMVHQRLEYLAAGMDGVVAKPISPAALLAEIATVIGQADEDQASTLEAL